MKKGLFISSIILAAVVCVAAIVCLYLIRPVNLYGQTFRADVTEINLGGENISSVDELIDNLSPFFRLKKLRLGNFKVPIEDENRLLSVLSDVDIDYKCFVTLYGEEIQTNVTSLDLSDREITDVTELSDVLKTLPYVTEVDLHNNSISPNQQNELIMKYPDVFFGWEVELLGKTYNSEIEELDLSGNREATPDLMRQYIPLFPKLLRLDMSDCGATNEEMAALRDDLPGIKVVWRIYMGKWSLKTDAVAFSVLIYTYDYKRLTTEDIKVLKYCTDLQALDLGHQAITDISVLGDYLPELRILILADNQVSDLTPVAKMKHLHYIELFVNSHKLCDLSPLASCKELVDANVSYLYNVKDISPLYDLPLLERIWFEHTPIPAEQVNTLREKHPDATIINQGTGSVDQGWRTHERYFAMLNMFLNSKTCTELSESFSKYDR